MIFWISSKVNVIPPGGSIIFNAYSVNAPFTKHLDFSIRQFNRKKEFPAFFCYTAELVNVLEDVYSQHESLSKLLLRVPPIVLQQFARFNVIEEIQSTNDIEGVQSTRQELRETFEQASSSARFAGIINRYNNLVDGRDIAFDTCIDIRIFYNTFTYDEVLRAAPSNKLDGKIFRAGSVDISSASGKTIHRGLFPEENIISAMNAALHILYDEKMPLLIRLAIFHYAFAYIHPFYDGNGRTGMKELVALTGKSRNTIRSRLDAMPPEHLTLIKAKPFRFKLNANIFKTL